MRDKNGRFVKGETGNPKGRPPRATETEYRDAVKEIIPLDRFRRQLEKLASRADRGDSRAFDKICDLLGLNVQKLEHTGNDGQPIQISVQTFDYDLAVAPIVTNTTQKANTSDNEPPGD